MDKVQFIYIINHPITYFNCHKMCELSMHKNKIEICECVVAEISHWNRSYEGACRSLKSIVRRIGC